MPVRIHKKEYKRPKYNYTCLCLLDLYHTLIPTALNLNCSLSRTSRPTPFTCLPKSKYKCFNSTTHSRLQPPPHRKNLNINALTAPHTHACSSSSLRELIYLLFYSTTHSRLQPPPHWKNQNINAFNSTTHSRLQLLLTERPFPGSSPLTLFLTLFSSASASAPFAALAALTPAGLVPPVCKTKL